MKVRFKKLNDKAVMPKKAHASDFGADLTVTSKHLDNNGNYVYGFGIAVEIPEGHVGLVFPRSSNAKKDLLLSNSVGCIDAHYRGEIMAKFKALASKFDETGRVDYEANNTSDIETYEIGDRACQLAIIPYPEVEYEEADELSETDRGAGGYGSTGA